ncbi:hypothetical protein BJ138DRAFT_1176169 [Hygrophoropsis aurantiaca]|uniref:Uncharacterized protein n=1 Tax=Hygrophoropsis aurantiaca TaxID=72124 RepID=A0ACB8AQM0_9AGAM|nr:hypothetical protein BJ138DRAFT_1176169 [Hygrophoropsis aurantiaca]
MTSTLPQESVSPSQNQMEHTTGSPLPQYGFGPEYTFDSLIQDNPFLFRVYTPKQRSPFFDTTEPFFVGQKFDESFTQSVEQLPISSADSIASISTYQDVAQHMDWTQRHMSPYISTTFSFVWAIWEATRRYRVGLKHDIEIAIIDSRLLAGRAATALELLRKGEPKERHLDYWKWYRFALESQDVLVHGSIPSSAVLASVPLLSIVDKLPSYFLSQVSEKEGMSPFEHLSWDTMDRKPSFRQFCQDMSDQFLHLSTEHRLRDATGSSVRLAMAFMRPWFHSVVSEDFTTATDKVCDLAFIIAQWPAQWWSRDHVEMWDVIRSLVQAVGEEVQEKNRGDSVKEVRRLQGVVMELERVLTDYEATEVGSVCDPSDEEYTKAGSEMVSPPEKIEIAIQTDTPPVSPIQVVSDVQCLVPVEQTPSTSAAPETPSSADSSKSTTLILSPTFIIQQPEPAQPDHKSERRASRRQRSLAEKASCIITGVFVGAFIALCVVNSQKRTLIYVT